MRERLLQIIQHYGIDNQLRKFTEECFELEEAIITHELKKSVEYEIPLTEIIGTKEHIAEEIADCLVMINQFIEYYKIDNNDVCKIMQEKVNRQLERIADEFIDIEELSAIGLSDPVEVEMTWKINDLIKNQRLLINKLKEKDKYD